MIRALVCGYGRFGRLYAERVNAHAELELVGVADPALGRISALHDGTPARSSLAEALEELRPALVIVAAPPLEHAALAVMAMEAGADVMLAKPGAVGMDDADTICAVAWSRGRRVVVDYTPTESPEWAGLLRQTMSERIITARLTRRGWARPQECGALWDLAPHDVALALALRPLDRVVGVSASAWWYAELEEPAGASIHVCHNSGRTTRIEVDWLGVVPERRVEVVTESRTFVWDQLAEKIGTPDNLTRALDRTLGALRGAPDDTDRLREVTRILELAEHDIYRRAATASATFSH